MSAYLKYYELEHSPFEGEGQTQVVLGTQALRDAFATIQTGLTDGSARICVSGGRGLGKTSLARALPKLLGEDARVAVVLDPTVSWDAVRGPIAKQWGLETGGLARSGLLAAAEEKRLVLVIDQAEKATAEFLDHLDIVLSYRSPTDQPVVQSILLAHLAADPQGEPAPLVWWLDRIQTLQLEFAPLPQSGVESYVHKHLKRAGWRGGRLFSTEAAHAIHAYTGGIPGEIGLLCEHLLMRAAEIDLHEIDALFVHAECDQRESGKLDDLAVDNADISELENEFGARVGEEPEAGPASGSPPSALTRSLEHFANAQGEPAPRRPEHEDPDRDPEAHGEAAAHARANDEADEGGESTEGAEAPYSNAELDDFLSRPATADELREWSRGGWSRYAWAVGGVAALALIIGITASMLRDAPEEIGVAPPRVARPVAPATTLQASPVPSLQPPASDRALENPSPPATPTRGSESEAVAKSPLTAEPKPLARIRGVVTEPALEAAAPPPSPLPGRTDSTPTPAEIAEAPWPPEADSTPAIEQAENVLTPEPNPSRASEKEPVPEQEALPAAVDSRSLDRLHPNERFW